MGELIEGCRPQRCDITWPGPSRPSAPPRSSRRPGWTRTACRRAWTRWTPRSPSSARRRSGHFLSVACLWTQNQESCIFCFGHMRVTRAPCWRWRPRTGRRRARLASSPSTRGPAPMPRSRTSSKEWGSIPTCPRPSDWSLRNLTRRSANPSRWSPHQLWHSLHLCTHSPDKPWARPSSTRARTSGRTLSASTRSSFNNFNNRRCSTTPAYSISSLSGLSSDCRTRTRPEQGGRTMDLWTVRRIWKKSITITIIRGADVPKNVTPCDQGMWKLERKNQVKQRLMATRHVWCITSWEVLMMSCINACSNQTKSHSLGQKKTSSKMARSPLIFLKSEL